MAQRIATNMHKRMVLLLSHVFAISHRVPIKFLEHRTRWNAQSQQSERVVIGCEPTDGATACCKLMYANGFVRIAHLELEESLRLRSIHRDLGLHARDDGPTSLDRREVKMAVEATDSNILDSGKNGIEFKCQDTRDVKQLRHKSRIYYGERQISRFYTMFCRDSEQGVVRLEPSRRFKTQRILTRNAYCVKMESVTHTLIAANQQDCIDSPPVHEFSRQCKICSPGGSLIYRRSMWKSSTFDV